MITNLGTQVWPDAGAPTLLDVGFGLARMPRFAGQVKQWYSVLNHVLAVAEMVPDEFQFHALLHDAAESIVGDVVTTWKLDATKAQEVILLQRISETEGVPWPWSDEAWKAVKHADGLCLAAEAQLLGHYDAGHPHFVGWRKFDDYERAVDTTIESMKVTANPLDYVKCVDAGRFYAEQVACAFQEVRHAAHA